MLDFYTAGYTYLLLLYFLLFLQFYVNYCILYVCLLLLIEIVPLYSSISLSGYRERKLRSCKIFHEFSTGYINIAL